MKKLLWFLILVLCCKNVISQVQFQNLTYDEALKQAAITNRMVFLQFESEKCIQCNVVANKAFENDELAAQLNETFICITINPTHPDRETVGNFLNAKQSFGSFFIDRNGVLLHSYKMSTTQASKYKEQIGIALFKSSEGIRISELEKEYREGDKSIEMLQAILLKRKSLSLETDSLLDVYVSILPADSLTSVATLSFIAKMAPLIGSNADNQLRKDYPLFNKAWYALPLAERVVINNRIIAKSMNKAVSEKNQAFAYRVASFNKSTYTNNMLAGENAFDKNILDYLYETKDTFNYLVRAVNYYDKYYMSVSIDTISKQNSLRRNKMFATVKGNTVSRTDSTMRIRKSITFSPQTQKFTQALNTGAWNFYKMSNDTMYLSKALQWVKRAVEFYESSEATDTYARLLYKTGKKEEAVFWELKTIALKQKRGYPTVEFEAVLNKMKAGSVKID
jgi:Protein of unknown function, DUF255